MNQIKEADWKIYRELYPIVLGRFCDRVLAEVRDVASKASVSSHDRYLAIYALMKKRDEEIEHIFDTLRRSTALRQIGIMRDQGLITNEEFARFGAETRAAVDGWLALMRAS